MDVDVLTRYVSGACCSAIILQFLEVTSDSELGQNCNSAVYTDIQNILAVCAHTELHVPTIPFLLLHKMVVPS